MTKIGRVYELTEKCRKKFKARTGLPNFAPVGEVFEVIRNYDYEEFLWLCDGTWSFYLTNPELNSCRYLYTKKGCE